MNGPPKVRRDGERGWSLLELMICFAILSTLIAALMSSRVGEARVVAETRDEIAAQRIASARLEALVAGRTPAVAGRREFPLEGGFLRALPGARAEEVLEVAGPGLLSVEVRVSWSAAGGEPREFVLSSLVNPGGAR